MIFLFIINKTLLSVSYLSQGYLELVIVAVQGSLRKKDLEKVNCKRKNIITSKNVGRAYSYNKRRSFPRKDS